MTNHVLNHDSKILQHLFIQLEELEKFNILLERHLEPKLAEHCQVFKFDKNCLFVIVDNGHWATQLRFQIPNLLAKLREEPALKNLKGIISKTRPHPSLNRAPKPASRPMAPLSQQTAQAISEIADSTKDTTLSNILKRISTHVEK